MIKIRDLNNGGASADFRCKKARNHGGCGSSVKVYYLPSNSAKFVFWHLTRNQLYLHWYRGFESHRLRQKRLIKISRFPFGNNLFFAGYVFEMLLWKGCSNFIVYNNIFRGEQPNEHKYFVGGKWCIWSGQKNMSKSTTNRYEQKQIMHCTRGGSNPPHSAIVSLLKTSLLKYFLIPY